MTRLLTTKRYYGSVLQEICVWLGASPYTEAGVNAYTEGKVWGLPLTVADADAWVYDEM